jgi:hypothetical protein
VTLFTLFLFVGAPLGFCFRVLILIPVIIGIVVTAGGFEMARGQGVWAATLTVIAAVIAIQIGYLGGAAAHVVVNHALATAQNRLRLDVYRWFSRFIHP